MADLFTSRRGDDRPKADRPGETNLRPCSVSSAGKVPPILSPEVHVGYPAYTIQPGARTQTRMAPGVPVAQGYHRGLEGSGSLKI